MTTSLHRSIESKLLHLDASSVRYGLGCAWVGRYGEAGLPDDVALLQNAYSRGFRDFDTAPAYAASALRARRLVETIARESILLATKVSLDPALSARDQLLSGIERSLQRLRTSHIDLLQVHDISSLDSLLADDQGTALAVLLNELRGQGLIRYFGLATRSINLLLEGSLTGLFDSILTYSDLTPIDPIAAEMVAQVSSAGLAVINGSPLAQVLTGKDPALIEVHPTREERKRRAMLAYEFCQERGVSLLAAALQFPLKNEGVDITLTGPGSPEELASSLAALRLPLPEGFWEEWDANLLDRGFSGRMPKSVLQLLL